MKKGLIALGLATALATTGLQAREIVIDPDKFFQEFSTLMNKEFKEYQKYFRTLGYKHSLIDNGYLYEFEVPGIDKKDITMYVENNYLIVKAKNKTRNYEFMVKLNSDTLKNKIEAELKNGILKVLVPRQKELEKPRKLIEIK